MLSYIVDHSCFHLNVQPVRLNADLFAALIPPDTELMNFFKKARPVNCPCLRSHVVHSLLHKRTLTSDDIVLTDMYCLCKYEVILTHNDVQFSPFICFYK